MPVIKLDKHEVNTIKALCKSTTLLDREIAEMYGVTRKHINRIRNKQCWNYEYERIDIHGQKPRMSGVRK